MGHQAIPLGERRCTTCGRGVDEGAQFRPRPRGGPHSYFAVCRDCDNERARVQTRIRRGWDAESAQTTPRQRHTALATTPPHRVEAEPVGGVVATGGFLERWEGAE